MATLILRPTSGTGTSWSNISNAYDGDDSTTATVSIKSSNYSTRTATFNFDTTGIPSDATINNATLTIRAKTSSSFRTVNVYADINGSSSSRAMNKKLSTTITNYTADVSSYINSLSTIKITGYTNSSNNSTFSLYEIYITIDYTEDITSKVNNIYIGDFNILNLNLGSIPISKVYIGDILMYESSNSVEEKTNLLPPFSEWTNELVGGNIYGDYSMSSNGGAIYVANLQLTSNNSYTIKVDNIGSQTHLYFFDVNIENTLLSVTPDMFSNNTYIFTPTETYGAVAITNWEVSSYTLSVENLSIYMN